MEFQAEVSGSAAPPRGQITEPLRRRSKSLPLLFPRLSKQGVWRHLSARFCVSPFSVHTHPPYRPKSSAEASPANNFQTRRYISKEACCDLEFSFPLLRTRPRFQDSRFLLPALPCLPSTPHLPLAARTLVSNRIPLEHHPQHQYLYCTPLTPLPPFRTPFFPFAFSKHGPFLVLLNPLLPLFRLLPLRPFEHHIVRSPRCRSPLQSPRTGAGGALGTARPSSSAACVAPGSPSGAAHLGPLQSLGPLAVGPGHAQPLGARTEGPGYTQCLGARTEGSGHSYPLEHRTEGPWSRLCKEGPRAQVRSASVQYCTVQDSHKTGSGLENLGSHQSCTVVCCWRLSCVHMSDECCPCSFMALGGPGYTYMYTVCIHTCLHVYTWVSNKYSIHIHVYTVYTCKSVCT